MASPPITCPAALVSLAEAQLEKRPAKVVAGQHFADLYAYATALGSYATALERQAAAREAQIIDCKNQTQGDDE